MTEEIKINIPTPEEINRQIVESVAKSAIGEMLDKIIKEKVSDLGSRYSDGGKAIERVINDFITKIVIDILNNQHKEEMQRRVKELITDKMVSMSIDKLWERMFT